MVLITWCQERSSSDLALKSPHVSHKPAVQVFVEIRIPVGNSEYMYLMVYQTYMQLPTSNQKELHFKKLGKLVEIANRAFI